MSTPITQGEAVYQEVSKVLKGVIKDGIKVTLTDEQRAQVCAALIKGFEDKRISLKPTPANQEKMKDAKLLKSYVTGLLNNWLKKDKRLNGKGSSKEKPTTTPTQATPVSAKPATVLSPTAKK